MRHRRRPPVLALFPSYLSPPPPALCPVTRLPRPPALPGTGLTAAGEAWRRAKARGFVRTRWDLQRGHSKRYAGRAAPRPVRPLGQCGPPACAARRPAPLFSSCPPACPRGALSRCSQGEGPCPGQALRVAGLRPRPGPRRSLPHLAALQPRCHHAAATRACHAAGWAPPSAAFGSGRPSRPPDASSASLTAADFRRVRSQRL